MFVSTGMTVHVYVLKYVLNVKSIHRFKQLICLQIFT